VPKAETIQELLQVAFAIDRHAESLALPSGAAARVAVDVVNANPEEALAIFHALSARHDVGVEARVHVAVGRAWLTVELELAQTRVSVHSWDRAPTAEELALLARSGGADEIELPLKRRAVVGGSW